MRNTLRSSSRAALGVVAVLAVLVATALGASAEWAPKGNVSWMAGAGPGSGWDTTARAALQAMTAHKVLKHPVTVVNKPGGAGAIAVAEMVNQHKGKDDVILVTSLPLITNKIMGTSPYGYKNLTPIVRLAATHYLVAVPANSDIKDFKDLIARLRKDPKSVSIGGSTPPADDWAAAMAVFGGAGLDVTKLKFIGYDGAQVAGALLGGHIQAAVNTVGEFAQHVEAGKMKPLATTGPEREPKFQSVPTVKESGVDVVFMNWRGFVGPPGMPKEALAYWQQKFGETVKTQTWEDLRARYSWADAFMADGFDRFLAENDRLMSDILKNAGVFKKK
ncbi:MAG: tripartite tricarboxylate transporter substrate binding protein [Candidatus Rokubacteria bacterium]|nr:tripartite tricarboxylate transporter substrate binding protein [Candidatus Rokubacteria bacterium]